MNGSHTDMQISMNKSIHLLLALFIVLVSCHKDYNQDNENFPEDTTSYVPALDEAQPILLNATGYNPNFMRDDEPWGIKDPDFKLGLALSEANCIRYPGGTFASYWDYDHDRLFRAKTTKDPGGWVDPIKIKKKSTADLIASDQHPVYSITDLQYAANGGSDGKNVNVVFHMNMITPGYDFYKSIHPDWTPPHPGSSNLTDTWYKMLDDRYNRFKKMLLRAKSGPNRIPIRYIEFGNEYYFSQAYNTEAFPSGNSFGIACNYIAQKLRNDPDLKLPGTLNIAATATCVPIQKERIATWNKTLSSVLDKDLVNSITIHAYQAFEPPADNQESSFFEKIITWQEHVNTDFTESGADEYFINLPGNARWPVWYTETNANWEAGSDDTTSLQLKTWAQTMMEPYSAYYFYTRGNATLYLQFHFNSIVKSNEEIVDGVRLDNRGLALIPFMKASTNAIFMSKISFKHTNLRPIPGSSEYPVAGLCFINRAGEKKCMLINLSGSSRHLNLSKNIFIDNHSSINMESYSNTLGSSTPPHYSLSSQPLNNLVLLPYSVNYIYE